MEKISDEKRKNLNLKHLSERIAKHEASYVHITNKLQLETLENVNDVSSLNDAWRLSVTHHNQDVTMNRHVLKEIINYSKVCGTPFPLPLRGHEERGDSVKSGIFLNSYI